MKLKFFISITLVAFFAIASCRKEKKPALLDETLTQQHNPSVDAGATQIGGLSTYATPEECNSAAQGASFSLKMTGDLEGCHYVFVEEYECSPSGTYRESGKELFVGTYNGEFGTFWTTYKFEARYEGCSGGAPVGAEIFGRCQHPIVAGTGTGVFEGVTGRLDFKDDIEAGNFPYRGHLRF